MPLLVGGALLVLLVLLSLSASGGTAGQKRALDLLLGVVAVGLAVLVGGRAGPVGIAVAVALLWFAAQRLGRRKAAPPPGTGPVARSPRMTREEAFRALGLDPGASREEVLAQYRRLMKKVHPDQGGTAYLAARLNEAKDVLLGDG